jgi:FkbM family methyltransferase
MVRTIAKKLLAQYGVILSGAGRGMRFDPTGGNLRYILGPIIPYEENTLVRYLQRGAVFYDIGANIGFYALIAARTVGDTGKVYAFEPIQELTETIQKNARLNKINHLTVVNKGVGEQTGTMQLMVSDIPEISRVVQGEGVPVNGDGSAYREIPVVSIDDFVFGEKAPPPQVVMIDVEGAEFKVLRGMKRTLREHRPVILCENHWILDEMMEYCNSDLKEFGYVLQRMDGGELPTEPTYFHMLLLPKERV